jgi:hypothetical protein
VLTVWPGGTNSLLIMPRMSKNTMSMVFVELRLILAFFGRGDDGLFHCDDFISRSYPWLVFPPFSPWCNRRLPHTHTHTRDHKNTNVTTPDVNTEMSLGTLPYQDWRSLYLRAQPCAAICWRATNVIRKVFDTVL